MIYFIKGTLEYKEDKFVVINCNGVGYRIFVSPRTLSEMGECSGEVKLFTYMSVKEDAINLFGFSTDDELKIFNLLITVPGLGPKVALSFLSEFTPTEIIMAILSDDTKTLSRASGVGVKLAQKVIIELKDKFKNTDFIAESSVSVSKTDSDMGISVKAEAVEALKALGYTQTEAIKFVNRVYAENMDTQSVIKAALKEISANAF